MRSLVPTFAVLVASTLPGAAAQILPRVPIPPGNELTDAKIRLGMTLFWDEQLSASRTVACGTCHLPEGGGSDLRAGSDPASAAHPGPDGVMGTEDDCVGSIGVPEQNALGAPVRGALFGDGAQVTDRRPRSVVGAAFMSSTFWDGRAEDVFVDPDTGEELLPWSASLETQSLKPLLSTVEMGAHGRLFSHVVQELFVIEPLAMSPEVPAALANWIDGRLYPALFEEAFGSDDMSAAHFAMAVASYERTLIPDQAPVLLPSTPLSNLELAGFEIFQRKGCSDCHESRGGLFTDQALHYIGQVDRAVDRGLGNLSGVPGDDGLFLTPSLLNVEMRAPYFHDGSKASLDEVLDFYSRGGDFGEPREREIRPAKFTDEDREALLAFLRRPLTDPRLARASGPFARPLLSTEHERRHEAAMRGISGPDRTPLLRTPSLIRAKVYRPFHAWLPARVDTLDPRGWVRLGSVPTADLMAMRFEAPPVVPVDPVFIGTTVLAEFAPLFAEPSMRTSVTIAVEVTL